MERSTEIVTVTSVAQVPSVESILKLPRERTLKIVFEALARRERETVGQNLRNELQGFQVGIHLTEPEINIAKLITNREVEENQFFFERCAQDYRALGEQLIYKLADKFGIEIAADNPNNSFYKLKREKRQKGMVGDWHYYLHGIHCGFTSRVTGQTIEVSLVHGLEFGDLDPYFFTRFIKSTPGYKPLPVAIYEDYADGVQIIEQMLLAGKFEQVNCNDNFRQAVVVSRTDNAAKSIFGEQVAKKKGKFNLLRFFRKR